jgi:hypothetical protein
MQIQDQMQFNKKHLKFNMNQDISKQNISRFSEITLDDEVIDSMQNEKELPS